MAAREPTDELHIDSDPTGAAVLIKPDMIRCVTPCTLKLARLLDYVVEVSKPGYATEGVTIKAGSNQPRAERHLKPNPVLVTLTRTGPLPPPAEPAEPAAPPKPPVPLPEPFASLDNCIQPAAVDRETCRGRIRLQMPRDVVEAVLGPPDATSRDESTLRYGDRYLQFDAAGLLVKISDQAQ
jgi:hypothetical protein